MSRTVAHFLDSEVVGGCEKVLQSLLTGLKKNGWEPILFHYASDGISGFVSELRDSGVDCRPVSQLNRRNLLGGLRQFASHLRSSDSSIFHAHLNWPLSARHQLLAARISGKCGTLATCHISSSLEGVRFRRLKQWIQQASVDRYIAVSNYTEAWLHEELRVPRAKINVVRNGIPLSRFSAEPCAQRDPAIQAPIVFTCARLHEDKGIQHLLDAASLVPEAHFVIAGDGPARRALEDYAKVKEISARVTFLGYRSDVPNLLSSADIFVLPSLHEALGLSILEAMAAGKPVVATAVGGIPELVIPNVTGLLVPPAQASPMASAIRRLLSSSGDMKRMGAAARTAVEASFSVEQMITATTSIYEDILERRSSEQARNSERSLASRAQA